MKNTQRVLEVLAKTGKTTYAEVVRQSGVKWVNIVRYTIADLIKRGVIDANWNISTGTEDKFSVIKDSLYYNIILDAFTTSKEVLLKDLVCKTGTTKASVKLREALDTLVKSGVIERVRLSVTSPVKFIIK
jgi:hypothetical protein